jgi:molybdenum cofactor cytidylyltransferase
MTSNESITPDLSAIILAAGASSRMGRLKPLLPLAGMTALERVIALFQSAGITDVIVVVGNHADELRPIIQREDARYVYNPHWLQGMYSSVVSGVAALPPYTRGAFVLPVDIPLVRSSTVRQLADAFRPDRILYPLFDNRRGHPPLIARPILDETARRETGMLRALLLAHESAALNIPVADHAIHLDMDTPRDFNALQQLASRRDIPTAAECEALLAIHNVSEPVIRHSRKVAEVACRIADALLRTGLSVDADLVRAGALLHDLCKGQPSHAEAAAAILRTYSMRKVAEMVAAHTDINFSGVIDERAIVYLSDKLVSGDKLASIEERFRVALDRFRDNPQALAAACRRKAAAEQIAHAIESDLRIALISILADGATFDIARIPEVTA